MDARLRARQRADNFEKGLKKAKCQALNRKRPFPTFMPIAMAVRGASSS
jgi:hypothetical protein